MVKFRRRLLKNWSSAFWSIFLSYKVIFFNYVYKKFSQVTAFLEELLTSLWNHFSAILTLPGDSNITFIITFAFFSQLFSWIVLSLEHKNFNYLLQNKGNHRSNLSKIQKTCFKIWARRGFKPKKFTKSLSKLSLSTQ